MNGAWGAAHGEFRYPVSNTLILATCSGLFTPFFLTYKSRPQLTKSHLMCGELSLPIPRSQANLFHALRGLEIWCGLRHRELYQISCFPDNSHCWVRLPAPELRLPRVSFPFLVFLSVANPTMFSWGGVGLFPHIRHRINVDASSFIHASSIGQLACFEGGK